MRCSIISLGSVSSKWTHDALKRYFETVHHINLKEIEVNIGSNTLGVLYRGLPFEDYDCVYLKGSFRYAPLLNSIASALSEKTYMPLKPEAFSIAHDKLSTHIALQQYNIPMPRTYISATTGAAKKILEKANYPIVMKFPRGTQGKGVMFADSFSSASSLLDALDALRQPFIIQEYVETGGSDTRALIVGNRVVAAMRRKAIHGESRSNIHAGGEGTPCVLDSYTTKIALSTAKAIGAEICAVDILESHMGPVVIEANISPGLQGISKATKIDVADKIARHLFEHTRSHAEAGRKTSTSRLFDELGIPSTGASKSHGQQIISHLDFRGDRMLLPKIASDISRLTEKDEVVIKIDKGKIEIRKY